MITRGVLLAVCILVAKIDLSVLIGMSVSGRSCDVARRTPHRGITSLL